MMFAQAASFCVSAAFTILRAVSTSGAVTSPVMHGAAGIMQKFHHAARQGDKAIVPLLAWFGPPRPRFKNFLCASESLCLTRRMLLGIEIGGTKLQLVLGNQEGEIVRRERCSV